MENASSTIDILRELNSKLVFQVDELRKKFAEIEAENIEECQKLDAFFQKYQIALEVAGIKMSKNLRM
ncbi:hypothetical protein Glove_330g27 [Diversispora epigaea]|uniref:Uncharacterized protein n=1 Tax=Diversispora epigaea TaxID=1348612 RepID=A0A397HJQ1_9GLOM|nr:hypothetical protein Glove_330g27 [Diversispora epigaea]